MSPAPADFMPPSDSEFPLIKQSLPVPKQTTDHQPIKQTSPNTKSPIKQAHKLPNKQTRADGINDFGAIDHAAGLLIARWDYHQDNNSPRYLRARNAATNSHTHKPLTFKPPPEIHTYTAHKQTIDQTNSNTTQHATPPNNIRGRSRFGCRNPRVFKFRAQFVNVRLLTNNQSSTIQTDRPQ